jgi:hypothetical protein
MVGDNERETWELATMNKKTASSFPSALDNRPHNVERMTKIKPWRGTAAKSNVGSSRGFWPATEVAADVVGVSTKGATVAASSSDSTSSVQLVMSAS